MGLIFSEGSKLVMWGGLLLIFVLSSLIILLFFSLKRNKNYIKNLSYSYEEINALYEELVSTEETLRENYTILEEQNALVESKEEQYRKIFECTTNALLIFDNERKIVDANPLACSLYHGTREELIGKTFKDIIRPKVYSNGIYETIFDSLDKEQFLTLSIQEDSRTGETISLQIKGWRYYFKKVFYLLIIDDITSLNRQEEEIKRLIYFDQVTDLPNRMTLVEWIDDKVRQSPELKGAVLMLDLDDFKIINDSLGHAAGDQFLYDVARRLDIFSSFKNLVARYGGDKFVVALHDYDDLDVIKAYCENLINLFTNPFYLEGREFIISISIGIALYPSHGDSAEILLKKAELAMYESRSRCKNQFLIFNKVMEEKLHKKNFLLSKLRTALVKNQIQVVYQPQYNLKKSKICGLEALVRWQLPGHGIISPVEFIPLAENNGVINDLGAFVLEEACLFAKEINEGREDKIIVSVNLSPIQLMDSSFLEKLRRILSKTNLEPSLLGLEITEGIVMDSFKSNIVILRKLQNMGMKIALDDFGTGYSSLTYLKKLPINYLKLDKGFILDIDKKNNIRYLLEAIIRTAPLMGLNVIAEGIETVHQMDLLKNCSCDIIQGYLVSKPISPELMREFLKNEKTNLAAL